ncbi:MAG: trypsin-like peptidase domain-containing protein [Luteolibacter sp.]
MKFLLSPFLALTVQLTAQEPDARKMYETLEPSVVLISDAEGGGSGVVLSEDGLILTNYHVANTPLPQTVEAIVTEGGRAVKKVFRNVSLFKVHGQSDLALLKVDPAGSRFKPARISKSGNDTVAGGTCYAMGYPFVPGQEKPVLTITKGVISSARRTVENNPYIQLDAAINPGNSGGALLNDKGVVIGIPTLKFEGADRIGLAAPLAGLKLDQFVAPADKKGNPQEAARLSAMASALVFRDAFSFGTDSEAVALAVYLQREALALEPGNPQWSLALASMYNRLDKLPLALAYAESAVQKDSHNLFSRALLAEIQDALKQPDKAAENRLACMTIPLGANEGDRRKSVTEKLASHYTGKNDPLRAVYILSWAQETSVDELTTGSRLVLQKAADRLPASLIKEIMAKKSGHSIADMEAFAARSPAPAAPPEMKPPAPVEGATLQPETAARATFAADAHFKPGVTARLMDVTSGVVFHADRGLLEWTPPQFSREPQGRALFLLTQPDGSEQAEVRVIGRN